MTPLGFCQIPLIKQALRRNLMEPRRELQNSPPYLERSFGDRSIFNRLKPHDEAEVGRPGAERGRLGRVPWSSSTDRGPPAERIAVLHRVKDAEHHPIEMAPLARAGPSRNLS